MPYSKQPSHTFWKLCLEDQSFLSNKLFDPKFPLKKRARVATAGSCFAQNIGRFVAQSQLELVDVEPAPFEMSKDIAKKYGYGIFSARYGNIYTARQLRQLLSDSQTERVRDEGILSSGGRFYDGLRPNVEPSGFKTKDELISHRIDHLKRVRSIFTRTDLFVFTLGLSETWQHRKTGLVFPTAPGTVAGDFDPSQHSFINLGYADILDDLETAIDIMQEMNPQLRILLTVSPVPLTATASDKHILAANTYSKSLLRVVAEDICRNNCTVDYFPSYEIITGAPFIENSYESNLRSVKSAAVEAAMWVFFDAYPELEMPNFVSSTIKSGGYIDPNFLDDELVCEERLLEAFASK